jgi:hypothetical protein
MLIIGRPLDLSALDLRDPRLIVRQNIGGRWNVQDVIELLARAGGKQKAEESNQPAAALPRVTIANGTLEIFDRKDRHAVIQPISLEAKPDSLLLWRYEADVPTRMHLLGEVAPGGRWNHQVQITAQNVDPWVAAWISDWPDNAMLDGRWAGYLQDDGISGRLDVRQSQFGDFAAAGGLVISGNPSNLRIRPEALTITSAEAAFPEVRTTGGTTMLVGSTIKAEGLRLAVANGMVDVDGEWNFFAGTASIAADWEIVALPRGATHSGSLSGSLVSPWPNQLELSTHLQARGAAAGGNFNLDVSASGQGTSWNAMNIQLSAPQIAYAGRRSIAFNDVVASVTTSASTIALNDIRATSGGSITGNGAINLDNHDWRLWLDAGGWTLPRSDDATLTFMVNAWGNRDKARLKQLYIRSGDVDVVVDGWYVYAEPKPLDADLYITHLPEVAVGGDAVEESRAITGRLRGDGHLNGTIHPLELSVNGTLFGRNLFIRQRPLGDVAIILKGSIDENEAQLRSEELALLGGRWKLSGFYPWRDRASGLTVEVQDLPLAEVSDLMETANLAGTVDGRWIFDIPELSRSRVGMEGSFEAMDVRAPNFAADRIEGKTSMAGAILSADPVVLSRGEGSAEGNLSVNVNDYKTLKVKFASTNWPVTPDRGTLAALVTGNAEVDIDLADRTAFGPVEVAAEISRAGEPLGQARLQAQLTERIVDVRMLEASALGGRFTATGSYNIDKPLETIAQAEWDNLEGPELSKLFPRLDGLEGAFGGAAKVAPAKDPRAIEPLRLSMAIEATPDANYRGAQIGNAEINAFMNTNRFVVDHSTFLIADGTVEAWMRTSQHETAPLFTQLIVNYDHLDLDKLAHAGGAPRDERYPGRLTGRITLVGNPRERSSIFGNGNVSITESDLRNSDIIAPLYNAMNLGTNWDRPIGYGSASLRIEQSTLHVDQARYFNRGTEVRADLSAAEIWGLPDNPISGYAVGSARPLKDIKLPFLADADEILSVLQTNVASVRIDGTVRHPRVELIPFSEIGGAMRRFIFGDVKQQSLDD